MALGVVYKWRHSFSDILSPLLIVTHFNTETLLLLSQILDPPPPKKVMSFMDDPLVFCFPCYNFIALKGFLKQWGFVWQS